MIILCSEANVYKYEELLEKINQTIDDEEFIKRHRVSKKSFVHNRVLTFRIIVLFLLNILKSSLQNELDRFFQGLLNHPILIHKVSDSTIRQARLKLKSSAFVELNKIQVDYYYENFEITTWLGHRLFAIDGSAIELPNSGEIRNYFGVHFTIHVSYNGWFVRKELSSFHAPLNSCGILMVNNFIIFSQKFV